MKNNSFLHVDGVSKVFQSASGSYEALGDVSFSLARGEFISLIGPSGCGKSTLLRLVAGIESYNSGSITLEGEEIQGASKDRAMVFQNHALFPWLTVYENILFVLESVFKEKSLADRDQIALQYLDLVHLTEAKEKKPSEISGGMKQRVGIARALAIQPKILLLDEPFGALDALTRGSLQVELGQICHQEQKSVLMVTHDIEEALFLSDRLFIMSPGPKAKIIETVEVDLPKPRDRDEILSNPRFIQLKKYLLGLLLHQTSHSNINH